MIVNFNGKKLFIEGGVAYEVEDIRNKYASSVEKLRSLNETIDENKNKISSIEGAIIKLQGEASKIQSDINRFQEIINEADSFVVESNASNNSDDEEIVLDGTVEGNPVDIIPSKLTSNTVKGNRIII